MKKTTFLTDALEQERLFGDGVDIFKNYYAVLGINNILSSIGLKTSSDNDWFRALAEYVTSTELAELYDKILSPDNRRNLASSRNHRTPPEINDDDPDDILSYLSKNVIYRKKMYKGLARIFQKRLTEYKEALNNSDRNKSAVEIRFEEMRNLFELKDSEVHLVMAVFLSQTRACELGDFDINRYHSGEKVTALARILGILDVEAAALLDDRKNIKKYCLIDSDLDLDRTFLSYLSGISSKPLAERFWTKYEGEVLPWEFHGKLAEKHGEVLKKMILSKPEKNSCNAILYGVPGSGKSSFAVSLAAQLKREIYFIAQNDDNNHRMTYSSAFRYAALAVAQKQLDPEKVILCIDECDRLVENSSFGGGLMSLFGINVGGSRDGEAKGQLNSVIDNSRHTILWICNSEQKSIDPSSRRRFDYSIFFDELSSTARTYIWRNALKFYNCEGRLSDEFIDKISSRYRCNPGGISLAVKNAAAIAAKDPGCDFESEALTFLKAHCSLLGIQESPEEFNQPVGDYSLEGLNIRSGIKLPRLIEAAKYYLKNASGIHGAKKMCILCAGVPGAGKTQFCKYLAQQLGLKISIKNASDLLSMYVGGTEQRISAAFAEAEANHELLFIDEIDSMLSSRDNAFRTYELSQVNTLLSEMEKFKGIFVAGTNLLQKIDPAALRRFNFRIQFDFLANEGKEIFFETYFTQPMGLKKLTAKEKELLFAIDKMTPSDFNNVREQFYFLEDTKLSNMEIIEALQTEIASKTSGSSYKGLGEVVHKMGF